MPILHRMSCLTAQKKPLSNASAVLHHSPGWRQQAWRTKDEMDEGAIRMTEQRMQMCIWSLAR